jgi:hypothetical protein
MIKIMLYWIMFGSTISFATYNLIKFVDTKNINNLILGSISLIIWFILFNINTEKINASKKNNSSVPNTNSTKLE